jgi:hypothetical protein
MMPITPPNPHIGHSCLFTARSILVFSRKVSIRIGRLSYCCNTSTRQCRVTVSLKEHFSIHSFNNGVPYHTGVRAVNKVGAY